MLEETSDDADERNAVGSLPLMGAEAKNLEAISKAIDQHNQNCPFPAPRCG
jgi:hypothetical protein